MVAVPAPVQAPEVVEKTLRVIASQHGFQRPRFHVEKGNQPGEGYMSELYRSVIEDEDTSSSAKEPLLLMVKVSIHSSNPALEGAFVTEGHVYETVIPAMEDIAGFKEPLPWPKCYLVSVTGAHPHCLAVADLRPFGYAHADRSKPYDLQHCRLVVQALARYHGAGMALQHLRPDAFGAMLAAMAPKDPNILEKMKKTMLPFLLSGAGAPDMIRDRFPEGGPVHTKLKKLFADFVDTFFLTLMPDPEGGNTLTHGDCHGMNILFQYDKKTGAVTGCRLIDFQAAHLGVPTVDLFQLLLPSTDKALRDAHWEEILKHYHQELQATLRASGCQDPDAIYSWARFKAQMKRGCEHALCMSPLLMQGNVADEATISAVQDMLSNFGKSEEQAKNQTQQPGGIVKETPLLKQRFGDLVQDLLEWGYL